MLAAIPGYAHLRVYIPDEPDRNPDTSETDIDVLHQFAPLLQIALEVLSGLRPEHQIRTKRFGPAVRNSARPAPNTTRDCPARDCPAQDYLAQWR